MGPVLSSECVKEREQSKRKHGCADANGLPAHNAQIEQPCLKRVATQALYRLRVAAESGERIKQSAGLKTKLYLQREGKERQRAFRDTTVMCQVG